MDTEAEVERYLNDYWMRINARIDVLHPNRSIKDYPEVERAFEQFCQAWRISFKQNTTEAGNLRDQAMKALDDAFVKHVGPIS